MAGGRSVTDGLCADELLVGALSKCVRTKIYLLCADRQEKNKSVPNVFGLIFFQSTPIFHTYYSQQHVLLLQFNRLKKNKNPQTNQQRSNPAPTRPPCHRRAHGNTEPLHRNIFAFHNRLHWEGQGAPSRVGLWACLAFCFLKQGPLQPQKRSLLPCSHAGPDDSLAHIHYYSPTSRTARENKQTRLKERYQNGSCASTVIQLVN